MRHKDMNELMLEHKLLTYAKTARIYQRRSAGTRERRQHLLFSGTKMEDGSVETWYFAVYNFIEGRATYDWINNMMPQYTYESVAELLAELHNAVRDFDPENL